jgi:uroporphyrinogen-III synthase
MPADLPLRDTRIVVTRPARQAAGLCDAFAAAGAAVIAVPAFRLEALADTPLATRLAGGAGIDADTVIFTSPSAVEFFFDLAGERGAASLAGCEVAAVGPSTARVLETHGVAVHVQAAPHTAEGMVAALRSTYGDRLRGRSVLYPHAADARDVIERELGALGAHVDAVVTYGAVPETLEDVESLAATLAHAPDVITFASPSAAIHLEATLTPPVFARVAPGLMSESMTACIGPITAEAVRSLGYRVGVVAPTHTADGLVKAVVDYYHKER